MTPCRRCGVPWDNPDPNTKEVCNQCWIDMGQMAFEDDESLGFWTQEDAEHFWDYTKESS